ncbi:MAG: hypothetical protein NTU78_18810 [Alphaproteobacteria bacterium]|jgi:hypothetical protein|nr:hypothetical protein [Alphaproteobacteria bacterium]
MNLFTGPREDVMCTVHVVNTFESLAAHVELDGNVEIKPGDEVLVHGKPIVVPYGETTAERRKATIKRAGWIERKWVKMTGDLEFMELLEFSFSGEEL